MTSRLKKFLTGTSRSKPTGPEGRELICHTGVPYLDYIQSLAVAMNASRYLEIGTSTGASLARINCASVAIDPAFQITMPVTGKKPACHLYQMTSDDYFANHYPKTVLGGTIDFAFLDGMHRYEYLLRDFINAEKHCAPGSVILLHDCLPPTFEMTNREGTRGLSNQKYSQCWTGDVWKVVAILKQWRPDLKMRLLDCPPTGIVAISALDPTSDVLGKNYDRIVEDFAPKASDIDDLQVFIAANQPISSKAVPPQDLLRLLKG